MTKSFDFDTWMELARLDPDAFGEARQMALEQVIAAADNSEKLRCLQWRVDSELLRTGTPLQACLSLSGMILEKFNDLLGTLMLLTAACEAMVRLKKVPAGKNSSLATESAANFIIQNHAGRRILLVDDEPINRELMFEILSAVELIVDVSKDGIEALELAERNNYDLILMDIQMPNMDGFEATRAMRKLRNASAVPIIAFTANVFANDERQCQESSMNDFVTKPVAPDKLFKTVLKWLAH